MLPEELRTQKHDEKNCLKFGSLKKKREIEDFVFHIGAHIDPKMRVNQVQKLEYLYVLLP